jgi:hypothetical protein
MGIQITATGGIVKIGHAHLNGLIPEEVLADLAQFLLDKRSGNIIFNVKEGRILGAEFPLKKSYST